MTTEQYPMGKLFTRGYQAGWNAAMDAKPAQQEPVAWRVKVETKLRDGSVDFGYQLRNERLSKYDEPLYTFPPAQRTWVGLTAEEIDTIYREIPPPVEHWKLSRAIEAKLKEKNNGN